MKEKQFKYIGIPAPRHYKKEDYLTGPFSWWSFIKALIKGLKYL